MKQLLQNLRNGETVVADVPVPAAKPGFALVHTAFSLVSAGTERMLAEFAGMSLVGKARSRPDLVRQTVDKARRDGPLTAAEAAFNRLDQPMALGYSSSGTVVAAGEGLRGFAPGDRVACAGGGYAVHAEYALVPQNLLAAIPPGVDFEQASFATLGAIAMHGFRLAGTQVGERVAVVGLGLLGLLAAGIARASGCAVFGTDLDPARVSLARQMGVEAVARPEAEEAAAAFSGGVGCDAVLICADTESDDPVELAGVIARDRARVVAVGAVGLKVPRNVYYQKELTLRVSRSYGPGRYDPDYEEKGQDYPAGYVRWTEGRNLEAFLALLAESRLDVRPLITHRIPIEQGADAYALITGKRPDEPFLGVLLAYPPAETADLESGRKVVLTPVAGERPAPESGLRLGVLGAGNYAGAVFFPTLKRVGGITRVGVASASGLSAHHAAHKFGFAYATSNDENLLTDPAINVIAVLTRHHLHARQTLAALSNGKAVYCEKPLALNEEELAAIAAEIDKEACPILTVGFNRRFAPLAKKMKEFVDGRSEPLVAHYRVNAGFLPATHWLQDPAQGGGRLVGEGCHFVDFLTFLVGSPPQTVSARKLPDDGRYLDDNLLLTFTFTDGSIGTLAYLANGDRAYSKERVEVFTSGRAAALDDFRTLELSHNGRRSALHSPLTQDKGHRGAWEAFMAAVSAGGPPPIPYEHLLGVTRATFAAVSALRSSEPGVPQPIPPVEIPPG
jgi:predicted dehydrogenase/threonine dehydrogenase-like Zn-dependent dehydrogenase